MDHIRTLVLLYLLVWELSILKFKNVDVGEKLSGGGRQIFMLGSPCCSALRKRRSSKCSVSGCILPMRPALDTPSMASQVPLSGVHARQSLGIEQNTKNFSVSSEVAAERTQHKNLAVSWLTVCFLFSQGHLLGISSYI